MANPYRLLSFQRSLRYVYLVKEESAGIRGCLPAKDPWYDESVGLFRDCPMTHL